MVRIKLVSRHDHKELMNQEETDEVVADSRRGDEYRISKRAISDFQRKVGGGRATATTVLTRNEYCEEVDERSSHTGRLIGIKKFEGEVLLM